jgi:hypothetical protein
MGKTYKDLKKQGKHVFDGPNVKQRKHFAPEPKRKSQKKARDRMIVETLLMRMSKAIQLKLS